MDFHYKNNPMDEIKKSEEQLTNENNPKNIKTITNKKKIKKNEQINENKLKIEEINTTQSSVNIIKSDNLKKVNKIIEESLDKLRNKNNILAYSQKCKSFEKLSSYCKDPETVIVDLSINNKIEDQFLIRFGVVNLPCLLSYGIKIYDNENLEDNLMEREKREVVYFTQKVKRLVKNKKIFIFIKGTPEEPKCKFTKSLLEILTELNLQNGLDYDYYNILTDQVFRNKIKIINEWPTFPQIFIREKFIGGINSLIALKEQDLINDVLK